MERVQSNKFSLSIKSDICYLDKIEKFLIEVGGRKSVSKADHKRILLCILEGVSNAIIHGNESEREKQVRVEIAFEEYICEVMIEDDGSGFDFTNVPDPTNEENIKKENGRGIYIIRLYSDDIQFFKNGSGIKILFNLNGHY